MNQYDATIIDSNQTVVNGLRFIVGLVETTL
jgi:hypothetical protein